MKLKDKIRRKKIAESAFVKGVLSTGKRSSVTLRKHKYNLSGFGDGDNVSNNSAYDHYSDAGSDLGDRISVISVDDISMEDFAIHDEGKGVVSDVWSVDSKFSVSRRPGEYPGQSYVVKKFEEYLEMMAPLSEEEERNMRALSVEEKWKIVFNLQIRSPIYCATYYIEELRTYTNYEKKNKPGKSPKFTRKTNKDRDSELSQLLRKLKLDLKMSYSSFVVEFLSEPYHGMKLLIDLLKDLHEEQQAKMSGTRRAKHDLMKKSLTDEYDTLLCMKFCLRATEALPALLDLSNGFEVITHCLMSSFSRSRVTALELLTAACDYPNGYPRVMEAITYLRLKFGESVRFKFLIGMLHSQGAVFVQFQGPCMKFLNKLISCESNLNARVYLQHEIVMAGFDADQLTKSASGEGVEFDDLQKEIQYWKDNYIDVQNIHSDLNAMEGRNFLLRQEVDMLQISVKTAEKEKRALERKQRELNDRCDDYQEKVESLQETVESLTKLYKERTGAEAHKEVTSLDDVMRPMDRLEVSEAEKNASIKSTHSQNSDPPPAPPPVPPSDSLPNTPRKKRITPNVSLPMFNWTTLNDPHGTVFKGLDNETIFTEVDFSDFEKKFELRTKKESKASKERRERALRRLQEQIKFIETARARNLIITKRRIGHSARMIRECIDKCDLEQLSGESAELLLKFVPTKDELRTMAQHAEEYADLAEAEQFMFQLAQVDRLESKLSVMAFMGTFHELINDIIPHLERVTKASHSIINNNKLKRIFEIILAFGNYMNSSKRGFASGFKLESLYRLSDIKASNDRNMTLMHYIEDTIERKYPELMDFSEDLHLDVGRGVSFQGMNADVHALRKGLGLVRQEKDKLDDPKALEEFYEQASTQVPRVGELYKRMEESYKEACGLFGESYKTMEPDAFFRIFNDFIASFKKASVDNFRKAHPEQAKDIDYGTLKKKKLRDDFFVVAKTCADVATLNQKLEPDNNQTGIRAATESLVQYISHTKSDSVSVNDSPLDVRGKPDTSSYRSYEAKPRGHMDEIPTNGSVQNGGVNWVMQNTDSDLDLRDPGYLMGSSRSMSSEQTVSTLDSSLHSNSFNSTQFPGLQGDAGSPTMPTPDYTNPNTPSVTPFSTFGRAFADLEKGVYDIDETRVPTYPVTGAYTRTQGITFL
ncbi:formin-like protein 3 isoform X2 [Lineus longissimus]|uniref:formin-like protein 3 isoform X2 n=1 Tax=Lineus longissimus TaxID=88925 RepID=UPI00315C74B8